MVMVSQIDIRRAMTEFKLRALASQGNRVNGLEAIGSFARCAQNMA
jgi:hypothetical protein